MDGGRLNFKISCLPFRCAVVFSFARPRPFAALSFFHLPVPSLPLRFRFFICQTQAFRCAFVFSFARLTPFRCAFVFSFARLTPFRCAFVFSFSNLPDRPTGPYHRTRPTHPYPPSFARYARFLLRANSTSRVDE